VNFSGCRKAGFSPAFLLPEIALLLPIAAIIAGFC
jgi:hypothetical protein